MPVSTIDSKPALVLIDLQKGITALPLLHPISRILEHSANLADAFRRHGLPVVLVNVAGRPRGRTEAGGLPLGALPPDWMEIAPELRPEPGDLRITKKTPGAFHGTSLHDDLQELGVTQIVLTGVATGSGVEATGRFAFEYGYNVVFATDAISDRDAAVHENSVARIFPKLGETGSTAEILALLEASRT